LDYSSIAPEGLLSVCLRGGDSAAWAEFVRRFQPVIASSVIRVARRWGAVSPSVVDDLIQETYLKLCADKGRLLQDFKSDREDAIYGYLRAFTSNLTHDHFKSLYAQKRGGDSETVSISDEGWSEPRAKGEPVHAVLEKRLLVEKIAKCLEIVISGPQAERDRQIFWFYYRVGLSASEIAALPMIGLSTKGVESTILRLTRAVRGEIGKRKPQSPSTNTSLEGISPENSF
jgi:RNA polymerase sigma-70 factor (ECF subfamily)